MLPATNILTPVLSSGNWLTSENSCETIVFSNFLSDEQKFITSLMS